MRTTSHRSTLLAAIDDVLRQPCRDPVSGQTVRGTELLRRTLLRMSDNGSEEAEELLQVIEENHKRKRQHRKEYHT